MKKKTLAISLAVAQGAILCAGAAFLVRETFFGPTTITAYFSAATAIYPGDAVRVSGVKVGTIDSISPEGTQTKLTLKVDRDVPIPADAKAVIVAQNLIAARYVQLAPAYRAGQGSPMRAGAVIPSDRTAVPVEWDEVKAQLMRLATDLGPAGGPQAAGHETSISRFIDSASSALDGNGAKLRQMLSQLSAAARIFADGSGNIVDIVKNLQTFVTALRDSKNQIVLFQNRLASVASVVNGSRSDLDAALRELSVAVVDVQRFVEGHRNQLSEQIRGLASVTQNLVDHRKALENVLHVTPNAIANYENIYNPSSGGVTGAVSIVNFANPVWDICSMIGSLGNVTAPETGKLCSLYLGPALRTLNFNNVPIPFNAYLRPAASPEQIIYTDPKLAPGGGGPNDAPELPPTISAYTGLGDVPPPAGWEQPPPPPGVYGQGEVPAIPSPPLYRRAPIPGPPTILPGPSPIDGMLLPQASEPRPSPAQGVPANAPPSPVEPKRPS